MDKLFSLLNPYRWWAAIAAVVVVLGGLTYAVHAYNTKITAQAVDTALLKERAVEAPKLKTAQTELANLKTQVITDRLAATAAVELERAKWKEAVNVKNTQYQSTLVLYKKAVADRDAARLAPADSERLLNNIATPTFAAGNGAGQQGISIGPTAGRFRELYQQCERDLDRAIATASEAVDRAAKSEAGVRALKSD